VIISIELLQAIDLAEGSAGSDERRALVVSLFEQEGRSLLRLARIFTDDKNAAEDLVQEAFIRLYRSANQIEDPDRSAAYLRSIVLNLARDHNRRGLLSLRHRESNEAGSEPSRPEDEVVRTEQQAEVIDALLGLSMRQRECLVLRFYFELTEREIAATLGISANSVKTHTRRGMVLMREALEEAS
jgi:RNA polymerase sigma-70 factor (sigma-E family)